MEGKRPNLTARIQVGKRGNDLVRLELDTKNGETIRLPATYLAPDRDELPMVVKLSMRGTPEEIKRLKDKLEGWLEEVKSLAGDEEDGDDLESWTGLLAMYPKHEDD